MDQTLNYGFPYPQCDPPLVKDASDIVHFKNLAIAVDSEVQRIATEADDLLITPDGVYITKTGSTAFDNNDLITFNTINFDNTGGAAVDLASGALVARQSGFYYICAYTQTGTLNSNMSLVFVVNGESGDRHNQGSTGAALITAEVTAQMVVRLEAGDRIQLQFRGVNATSLGLSGLSFYRVV